MDFKHAVMPERMDPPPSYLIHEFFKDVNPIGCAAFYILMKSEAYFCLNTDNSHHKHNIFLIISQYACWFLKKHIKTYFFPLSAMLSKWHSKSAAVI